MRRTINFGSILLAGGTGSRMRHADKLLLKINGETLVNRTYRTHREAGLSPVLVTGYSGDRFNDCFDSKEVAFVHNPNFSEGQHTSVLAGLNALPLTLDAVVISLSDMPLLNADDLVQLMRAYADRPAGCAATIPFNGQQRGNPVIIDAALIKPITQEIGNARAFLDSHPELIYWHQSTRNGYYIDLDTLEDLERLQRLYGISVEASA